MPHVAMLTDRYPRVTGAHRAGRIFRIALVALVISALPVIPALGFEVDQIFARNTLVFSGETYYGHQFNPGDLSEISDVQFVSVGLRLGWLPFDPVGPGRLRGSLEAGLEPIYQQYFEPKAEYFAGLAAVLRYHFLSLGGTSSPNRGVDAHTAVVGVSWFLR